jgi:hypothetical protein
VRIDIVLTGRVAQLRSVRSGWNVTIRQAQD